jgi:hypothetical protein
MALWEPETWDWAARLGSMVVSAGVGTALVQGLLPIYRDRRSRKLQAAYMAMRVAATLEFYASACAHFIQKNANVKPSPPTKEFPDWAAKLPELPAYPDDADGWRAIDCALAGRCLNLRNKIHGSQGIINSTIEYSKYDLGDALREHAAERGLEAWKLAVALRSKHGVEEADPVLDYADILESTLQKVKKSKGERRECNAEIMSSGPSEP